MDEFTYIAREEWPAFLDAFSHRYRGWLVRIWSANTVSLESGMIDNSEMIARDLALASVTLERHGDRDDLVIMLRSTDPQSDVHIDHAVQQVDAVMVERDEDGNDTGLLFNTADATSVLLRFRAPVDPATVDGIAPGETP